MTTDAVGGVWTYALELAEALGHAGVEVTLACLGPAPSPEQHTAALTLPNLRLQVSGYRLEWMAEPWQDLSKAARWLGELEREVRPDVVHLNGYALATASYDAPTVVVAHSCVASWWDAVRGGALPPEWARYRREVAAGLAAADCVVAPTTWMLRQIERHYGFHGAAQIIPNGRSPHLFKPGQKERLVFAAGRVWDEAKNLAALDRAAQKVPWPIVVAGETTRPEGGAVALPHVKLLGALSARHVAGWMAAAAVYALPARYEPFGLSALEAALSGCALVLGDIPSLREVWGDDALFVAPDDPAALGDALFRLATDAPLRRLMAARAGRRAGAYSTRRMGAAYYALYRRLSDARRRRRCVS
jgi:glycosyltransferase involved in cell wall biosynthesis